MADPNKPCTPAVVEPLEQRNFLSADLGIVLQSFPTSLQPGVTNRVNVRVTNSGDSSAKGIARITLHASADPAMDADDAQLVSVDKSLRLKAGKSTVVKLNFPSPVALADGNYSLLAQLESDPATIDDSNAANDLAAAPTPTAVRQPFVDLVSMFSHLPNSPLEAFVNGRDSCATVNVFNSGNVIASGPLAVSVYLSADATLDASDIALGTSPQKQVSIKAGAGKNVKVTLDPPPAGTPVGTYSLIAVVDPANQFVERDESNNQTTSVTQVPVVNTKPPSYHDHHYHSDHGYYWTGGTDVDTFYYFNDGEWYYPDEPVMVGNGGGSGGDDNNYVPPPDFDPWQDLGSGGPSEPETQPSPDPDPPPPSTQPSEPTTQPSEPDNSSDDWSDDNWDSGGSDDWDWDF